jgi:hypothetical protein
MGTSNSTLLIADTAPTANARPRRSKISRILHEVTPLLSVLFTLVAFATSIHFQMVQADRDAVDKRDAQWRSALEKISADKNSASWSAFEMETFFTVDPYSGQARATAANLLPQTPDRGAFDIVFFQMAKTSDQTNLTEILGIARQVSNDVRDAHDTAVRHHVKSPLADTSLAAFLSDPASFYDENDAVEHDELVKTLTEMWKLESVSRGLSQLWQGVHGYPHLSVGSADLTNILFLNNDFSGVDFKKASMNEGGFYGSCLVDKDLLPSPDIYHCSR